MGSLDHPVLRAAMILLGALGLTTLYITVTGPFNWPPFFTYPSVGSTAYISIFVVSALILGAIDWLRFRGHVRKDLVTQGVVQR